LFPSLKFAEFAKFAVKKKFFIFNFPFSINIITFATKLLKDLS